MKTIGDGRRQHAALQPSRDLWENQRFQDLIKSMEDQLKEMERLCLIVSGQPDAKSSQYFQMLGVEPPKTQEETVRLYFAIRISVNFWKWNLTQLKRESDEHQEVEKKLNEHGSARVGTAGRNVGARIR